MLFTHRLFLIFGLNSMFFGFKPSFFLAFEVSRSVKKAPSYQCFNSDEMWLMTEWKQNDMSVKKVMVGIHSCLRQTSRPESNTLRQNFYSLVLAVLGGDLLPNVYTSTIKQLLRSQIWHCSLASMQHHSLAHASSTRSSRKVSHIRTVQAWCCLTSML